MDKPIYIKLSTNPRSKAEIKALVNQLKTLINSLLTTALTSVENGNLAQYQLDTGQTKTNVMYQTPTEVYRAIERYENLLQRYQNMLTPRVVRLVDGKNFNGRR